MPGYGRGLRTPCPGGGRKLAVMVGTQGRVAGSFPTPQAGTCPYSRQAATAAGIPDPSRPPPLLACLCDLGAHLLRKVVKVPLEVNRGVQAAHDGADVIGLNRIVADAEHHLDLRVPADGRGLG